MDGVEEDSEPESDLEDSSNLAKISASVSVSDSTGVLGDDELQVVKRKRKIAQRN